MVSQQQEGVLVICCEMVRMLAFVPKIGSIGNVSYINENLLTCEAATPLKTTSCISLMFQETKQQSDLMLMCQIKIIRME